MIDLAALATLTLTPDQAEHFAFGILQVVLYLRSQESK